MKVVGLDMESREYMKELNISLVPSFIHVWKRNYFVLLLSFGPYCEGETCEDKIKLLYKILA